MCNGLGCGDACDLVLQPREEDWQARGDLISQLVPEDRHHLRHAEDRVLFDLLVDVHSGESFEHRLVQQINDVCELGLHLQK